MIVGAGKVANGQHLPAWNRLSEAQVVAVCDKNPVNLQSTAKKWNIPHAYADFDELLNKESKGIMDICTDPSTHVDLAIKALQNGHHVILEKPISLVYEEADRLQREYDRRVDEEIRLCIIQNFLFEPQMLAMRSLLQGRASEILSMDVEMLHTRDDYMLADENHWVHSIPGGRFGECAIHPIYILRNFLGPLQLRDVHCTKRGSYPWVRHDELHAAFGNENGFGSMYISFNSPGGHIQRQCTSMLRNGAYAWTEPT